MLHRSKTIAVGDNFDKIHLLFKPFSLVFVNVERTLSFHDNHHLRFESVRQRHPQLCSVWSYILEIIRRSTSEKKSILQKEGFFVLNLHVLNIFHLLSGFLVHFPSMDTYISEKVQLASQNSGYPIYESVSNAYMTMHLKSNRSNDKHFPNLSTECSSMKSAFE